MKHFISTIVLFLVCWQTGKANAPQPQDSVGIAKKNGNYFIIHEVETRQTLFALSKIYKVSIQEILEANEGMRPALATGQLLYVPTNNYKPSPNTVLSAIVNNKLVSGDGAAEPPKEVPPAKEKKEAIVPPTKKETPKEVIEIPEDKLEKFNWNFYYGDKDLFHTVKKGETLYKIATYYGLSVQELMELNKLENSLIERGQELLIRKGKNKKYTSPQTEPKEKEEPMYKQPKLQTYNEPDVEETKPTNTKEVKETGMVMVIDDNFPDADKNIALHTTAKVGTVILVTNAASKESVYVRVVGLLQTDDEQVVIMISPKAAKIIGIKGSKGQVQLSFAQ